MYEELLEILKNVIDIENTKNGKAEYKNSEERNVRKKIIACGIHAEERREERVKGGGT